MTQDHTNPIERDDDISLSFDALRDVELQVDQVFLDKLRESSGDVFEDSYVASECTIVVHSSDHASRKTHPMKTTVLVTTIAIVFSLCWLVASPDTEASGPKLGSVLAELEKLESLQLRVTRDQETANVWISNNSAIRWESSPEQYQIARGSKLWKVTDANSDNPQVMTSHSSQWMNEEGKPDLISLMGIESNSSLALHEAQPDGRANYSGVNCLVYRELVKTATDPVRLNFYVDQGNRGLVAVTARPFGAKRKGPPLAELAFVAKDLPLNQDKFRIPIRIEETNLVGKVVDSQGIVSLRPLNAARWTPLLGDTALRPKDLLRTDQRGANALTLELASGVTAIIGPGALLEVTSANSVRLNAGTIQLRRAKKASDDFQLVGGTDQSFPLKAGEKAIYQVDSKNQLVRLPQKPVWLSSYEGKTAEDSIGSLIVEVDGKATPLTVGEHHVTVEIRDQIARTTIEETFVNHTNRRMEGQFHFPLPQDASISGFGMWIGGELVEADIVEKQRAREIYETILREKRDPGLLEWTGGNIFKARVFPIEPHSEKRVKIVYTQVLPLQGNRYRYSYGLKSEMLQTNPLRELSIRCLVNSTVPLGGVQCPTHPCRTQLTHHSAELEFTAQEYTPTSDFEVVCDVSQRENDVVMIPHRRGNDGYFLLELMPPGENADWQRQTIGEGDPLEIILLCDTSGSMDRSMREKQLEFVVSLLKSLGTEDRFSIAATDVKTDWFLKEFTEPSDKNIDAVRDALESRLSLGWTDLDQAFSSVLSRATSNSQIIYIGDGIYTTSQSEPVEFVNRLRHLFQSKFGASDAKPALHAVSVGSSFESLVLKGIAASGGGSQRQISGDVTPQEAALDLLNEITLPGLKDVKVNFEGLRVAAVYPEQLPNIPVGTQQILVGRYLPTGEAQSGRVVVTGMMGGEAVKYVAKVHLVDAEKGNSFIPRLWARGHLDHLLQQGSSSEVQNQVIGLSEEFHIITPYTSLLILESDADRKRFGVKRRFGMRDGEQFFADGRKNAKYELKQQQMQNAGLWRVGLRHRFLSELAKVDRNADAFQNLPAFSRGNDLFGGAEVQLGVRSNITMTNGVAPARFDNFFLGDVVQSAPLAELTAGRNYYYSQLGRGAGLRAGGFSDWYGTSDSQSELPGLIDKLSSLMTAGDDFSDFDSNGNGTRRRARILAEDGLQPINRAGFGGAFDYDTDEISFENRRLSLQSSSLNAAVELPISLNSMPNDITTSLDFSALQQSRSEFYAGTGIQFFDDFETSARDRATVLGKRLDTQLFGIVPASGATHYFDGFEAVSGRYGRSSRQPNTLSWTQQLFPQLPNILLKPKELVIETTWSEEAVELSQSLVLTQALESMNGGLEVTRKHEVWSDDYDRLISGNSSVTVWSPREWAVVNTSQGQNATVTWKDERQRGVYSESFLLGQVREIAEKELISNPLPLPAPALSPLHISMKGYDAEVKKVDESRFELSLTSSKHSSGFRYLIDIDRNVVTRQQTLSNEQVVATTNYGNFVEVAGVWVPTEIVSSRPEWPDQLTYKTSLEYHELSKSKFENEWKKQLKQRDSSFSLSHPMPSVSDSLRNLELDEMGPADEFVLLLASVSSQNWEEAFLRLEGLEGYQDQFPGIRWIRIAVEVVARRNEDARQRLVQILDDWAKGEFQAAPQKNRGDLFLVTHLLSSVYPIIGWPEYAPLLTQARPYFERQPDSEVALLDWRQRWIQALSALDRADEKIAEQKALAADYPGNAGLQVAYAGSLFSTNQEAAGKQFLERQMNLGEHWKPYELNVLRNRYADALENLHDDKALLEFLESWLEDESTASRVFERFLSALVFSGRTEEADRTAEEWLLIAEEEQILGAAQQNKVQAAISFAFGRGHRLHRYHGMDRKWLPLLFRAAKACLQIQNRGSLATNITGTNSFQNSDEADRLRGAVLQWLLDDANSLSLHQLNLYINVLQNGRLLLGVGDTMEIRQVESAEWNRIAQAILQRWEDEQEDFEKHQLSQTLTRIYQSRLTDLYLPFLRRLTKDGSESYLATYRNELFNALLGQSWTEELEDELFQLWLQLSTSETEIAKTFELVPQLFKLVDAMLQNRIAAEKSLLQDEGQQDELTRTEKQKQAEDVVRQVQTDLADQLSSIAETMKESSPELAVWVAMERRRIDIALDRNHKQIIRDCWKLVGDRFVANESPEDPSWEESLKFVSDKLLTLRAFQTLLQLASQSERDKQLHNKLLAYVDSAIEVLNATTIALREEAKEGDTIPDLSRPWKTIKYKLLVLFDRQAELKKQLQKWIEQDADNSHWRHSQAMLLAEEGELQKAIGIFEDLKDAKRLSAADYVNLANWYLVLDDKQKEQANRIQVLMSQGENRLSNRLSQEVRKLRSGDAPHEIGEQTLLVLQALMTKASRPENYYYTARDLFTSTRDFRVLKYVPDSILGRTQNEVYSALNQLRYSVLSEVRKEAVADKMLEYIQHSRKSINDGNVPRGASENERSLALDLRALDLLEAMIEAKSAQVLNEPGQHGKKALAALERAFEHEWQATEPTAYAAFLQQLGELANPRGREQLRPLADQIIEQLDLLIDRAEPASASKMNIVISKATFLINTLGDLDNGLKGLEVAIREFAEQHDGLVPYNHYSFVFTYSSFLQQAKFYAKAEQFVVKHQENFQNDAQRWTYQEHLNRLYEQAFHVNAQVSLGTGNELFVNLIESLITQADTDDRNQRHNVLLQIGNLFNYAIGDQTKGPADEKARLLQFTRKTFPQLTANVRLDYPTSLVNHFASILQSRISPVEALDFVLTEYENYPTQLRYTSRSPWSQHASQLAQYRNAAADSNSEPERLKRLEERLLAIVLEKLREELVNQSYENHSIYHDDYSYFWKKKANEFNNVTQEVIAQNQDSPRILFYAANYLYDGLSEQLPAIDLLEKTNNRGLLDADGQRDLIDWMHRHYQYQRSIPILEKLLEESPFDMRLRSQLMRAYFETDQSGKSDELFAETDKLFHQGGRWTEDHIIEFARAAVAIKKFAQGAKFFEDAISLHQQTQPNRGIGNGTLSRYYFDLANPYQKMGQTSRAVDAAAAAVVSWGTNYQQRSEAVKKLYEIIRNADDFDAFLKEWDEKSEKSGQDSPLIRKAIADRFSKNEEYELAVKQYQIALELSPFDRELHHQLLQAYDALNADDEAITQLISNIDSDRHNLELYVELAKRTEMRPALAERAATSIVESAPNEAESHTALAKYREKQKRWDQAISHWQRAAELRRLEPDGLLGLANAQIQARKWKAADTTLKKLQRKEWPARFNDVESQIYQLNQKVRKNLD